MTSLQSSSPFIYRLASVLLPADSPLRRWGAKFLNSSFFLSRFNKEMSWDPWLMSDGKAYFLFYLVNDEFNHTEGRWWSRGDIALAVSSDLLNWKHVGKILTPDPNLPWESQRLCAGSAYFENGTYYLFYSSAGTANLCEEHICLANSENGLEWNRYEHNPILNIDRDDPWYGPSRRGNDRHVQCRDPYVIKNEEDGKYYVFFSTSLKSSTPRPNLGCVGVAVAEKIEGPYEILPPVTSYVPGLEETYSYEMERPQVVFREGKYHLFWSTFHPNTNAKLDGHIAPRSKTYHFTSDRFLGPYEPHELFPMVEVPRDAFLYAVNIFPAHDSPDSFFVYGWDHLAKRIAIDPARRFEWN